MTLAATSRRNKEKSATSVDAEADEYMLMSVGAGLALFAIALVL